MKKQTFQIGDRVKLVTLETHPKDYGCNWLECECDTFFNEVYLGMKLTVSEVYEGKRGTFLRFKELSLCHTSEKFKKIRTHATKI